MNVKKVITIALAVFVLCAVFCGAASAMHVQNNSLEITPSGSLIPGETVTAIVKVDIPKDTYTNTSSNKLVLSTDLDAANWSVKLYHGSEQLAPVEDSGKSITIDWFTLMYPEFDITIKIQVRGIVSNGSANQEIVAMKIDSYEAAGKYPTWSTPEQHVYSISGLNGELGALDPEIAALESRISKYVAYGWDVSEAQAYLNTAKSQRNEAAALGSTDVKAAYSKIEEAQATLKTAEEKLALASLSMTLSYTTYIQNIADNLYAKGWNSEAMLLDTKNASLKNTYNQQLAAYKAGNADAAALDTLANDSYLLYQDALVYEDSAKNPLGGLLTYLPFILIGLGAAAIIVVIVVVIVKKRKNSWDELG